MALTTHDKTAFLILSDQLGVTIFALNMKGPYQLKNLIDFALKS